VEEVHDVGKTTSVGQNPGAMAPWGAIDFTTSMMYELGSIENQKLREHGR
jgi:hypothetical protein